VIDWIKDDVDPAEIQQVLSSMTGQDVTSGDLDVWSLEEGQFLLPGLIDTHTVRSKQKNAKRLIEMINSMLRNSRTWERKYISVHGHTCGNSRLE
jgi:hypothetical protein